MTTSTSSDDLPDDFFSQRIGIEIVWVHLQPFLLARGYKLRSRYDPDWRPSWGNKKLSIHKADKYEDSLLGPPNYIIDATRISDGKKVVIKRVETATQEIPIASFLNLPHIRADPRNHTVEVLDILPIPGDDDHAIMVMPMLYFFEALPFRRVGEVEEALVQFVEALEFLHDHNISHNDICYNNMMMDPSRVIPKGFHFAKTHTHNGVNQSFSWRERWDVRPVSYFIIDFGISSIWPSKNDAVVKGKCGQDQSAPEFLHSRPFNLFRLDIYHLGNVIKGLIKACFNNYQGLEIFEDLARSMTLVNPDERPAASEALVMLLNASSHLDMQNRKRRIWRNNGLYRLTSFERFLIRTFRYNPIF
ncbi:hypothetical protein CVT26_014028 [Gymnopilus dilepis]|uniref:Protein kinase domain-containing protein n=1 Tax=Gymnopilus dilepis TaxID=231916 RepID=A0A409VU50_9AGAR|nr:hypothetical protein CVT26_014028 [Gymnopilus dilepis]